MTIQEITKTYKNSLDYLDIEILLANSLGKTREFVLMYPEKELSTSQIKNFQSKVRRRIKGEPIAYLLGHKEFYGLDFIANKHTLVPRPETELMVESAIKEISNFKFQNSNSLSVVDIGTGSGCIIISVAKAIENFKFQISNLKFIGTDISSEALKIAKKNAEIHKLNKQIKFMQGDLLSPIIENYKLKIENSTMIIVANLPYLSKEIYNSAPIDVKKYEPKSALYSAENGLKHYRLLLEQLDELNFVGHQSSFIVFLEISPEQKTAIKKLALTIFPSAKVDLIKDLTGRWRICKISI